MCLVSRGMHRGHYLYLHLFTNQMICIILRLELIPTSPLYMEMKKIIISICKNGSNRRVYPQHCIY